MAKTPKRKQPPSPAHNALVDLLEQLEGVGLAIRGVDIGQWKDASGLSFAKAYNAIGIPTHTTPKPFEVFPVGGSIWVPRKIHKDWVPNAGAYITGTPVQGAFLLIDFHFDADKKTWWYRDPDGHKQNQTLAKFRQWVADTDAYEVKEPKAGGWTWLARKPDQSLIPGHPHNCVCHECGFQRSKLAENANYALTSTVPGVPNVLPGTIHDTETCPCPECTQYRAAVADPKAALTGGTMPKKILEHFSSDKSVAETLWEFSVGQVKVRVWTPRNKRAPITQSTIGLATLRKKADDLLMRAEFTDHAIAKELCEMVKANAVSIGRPYDDSDAMISAVYYREWP